MIVNKYRSKKINRTLITPATSESRAIAKDSASVLQRKLANKIHPGIFGYPRGRPLSELVAKIMQFRAQGKYIVVCDLKSAFLTVDPNRLMKILRKFGVEEHSNLELSGKDGNPISFVGIPQGDARSPMLFAAFLTPLMNRLSRQCECYSWGDDLLLIADSEAGAEELIEYLKFCITKHSYKKARLKLSEKKHKQIRIIEPNAELSVLGLRFQNEIPFPADGKSAYSWLNLLQEIKRIFANEMNTPETRRIWMKLKSILPSAGFTTDSKGALNHLPWAGHDVATPHSVEALTPSVFTEGMDCSDDSGWSTPGVASLVGRAGSSTFSSRLRAETWQDLLWHHDPYLLKCFENYQSATDHHRKASLFVHFVNELETRFFMFCPQPTLSYVFRYHRGRLRPDHEEMATDLYHFQLRAINEFSGFELVSDNTLNFIKREKLQQILRGITTLKWLSLKSGFKIPLNSKVIMALGTFTFPYWNTWDLYKLCRAYLSGKISFTKFDTEIKSLRTTVSKNRGFEFGDPDNLRAARRPFSKTAHQT